AENGPLMTGANDGVRLPVAKTSLASHDRRPLLNADAIGNLGAARVTAITLALFLLTAQMLIEPAAAPFVSIDIEIDTLMTDCRPLLQFQATSDLFRTPLLPQQQLHQQPGLFADPRPMRPAAAIPRQLLCLQRAISLVAHVPPQ